MFGLRLTVLCISHYTGPEFGDVEKTPWNSPLPHPRLSCQKLVHTLPILPFALFYALANPILIFSVS